MARSHARLMATIWEDEDFINLTAGGQRLYMFLLSQNDLQHCGVIPLRERRWSKKAKNLTVGDIERDLKELASASPRPFVLIDEDTEELFVRSLMRRDKVYAQPNVFKAAADQIRAVSSRMLKAAILEELRRLPLEEMRKDVRQVLAELIADLERQVVPPSPTPSVTPSPTPSGTPSAATHDPVPDAPAPVAPTPSVLVVDAADAHEDAFADPDGVFAGHGDDLTPSRTPSEGVPSEPRGKGNGYGGEVEDSPFPGPLPVPLPAGTAAPRAAADAATPVTAQTLIAEWIDHVPKKPPSNVIKQVGKHLKAMLDEGIDPADVRRGLAVWVSKGLHPSTLPSVVNEVMNAAPAQAARRNAGPPPSRNRQILDAAMERAKRMEQAMAEQQGGQPLGGQFLKGELIP